MKIINKAILGIAIASLGFTSCDDYLTQVNPNELTTDSYFQNLGEINIGVTAIYNAFKNTGLYTLSEEVDRSDLAWPGWGRPNTTNEYYLQTFNDVSGGPNSKWDAAYQGIFRANQIIEALQRIEETLANEEQEENWVEMMAQARFFRGYFYFVLNNSFNHGSVPLITKVSQTTDDFFVPLSPSEDVVDFYTSDLEYAYANLPKTVGNYKSVTGQPGRITAGAAAAVLGKSYLYYKDYENARKYFKDIITKFDYTLVPFQEATCTTNGEYNNESILEVSYSINHKTEESVWSQKGVTNIWGMTTSPVGGWRTLVPSSWLTVAYKSEPIDEYASENFKYDDEGNQVGFRRYSWRASNSIALVDDDYEYYQKPPVIATNFNNKECGYFRKFSNWDIYETEKDAPVTNTSGVNMRLIRLADIYLMYAEALIEGGANEGGVQEAMKYINRVRHRYFLRLLGSAEGSEFPGSQHDKEYYDERALAGLPNDYVEHNATTLMDHLMYVERPLELSIEGNAIRHLDLRRWGVTKERFQDLASRDYVRRDYICYTIEDEATGEVTVYEENVTGSTKVSKWGSSIFEHRADDQLVTTEKGFMIYRDGNVVYIDDDGNKDNDKWEAEAAMKDYVQAANNYTEEIHDYWPIPNSETMANVKL